jgi:hypothetical protein
VNTTGPFLLVREEKEKGRATKERAIRDLARLVLPLPILMVISDSVSRKLWQNL